jgi:hypothetical protein
MSRRCHGTIRGAPRPTPAPRSRYAGAEVTEGAPQERGLTLRLGTAVRCADGVFGDLADFVIEPGGRRLTHLVVVPHHHHDEARMVPLDVVAGDHPHPSPIPLRASLAQAAAFPAVREVAYSRVDAEPPLDAPEDAVGIEDVLVIPSTDFGTFESYPYDDRVFVTYDRIPKGEVEIRHHSDVCAADGQHVGSLDGLVVRPDGAIEAIVLERGHLWRRRRITIPAGAVERFEMDVVTLHVQKAELAELLAGPGGAR